MATAPALDLQSLLSETAADLGSVAVTSPASAAAPMDDIEYNVLQEAQFISCFEAFAPYLAGCNLQVGSAEPLLDL